MRQKLANVNRVRQLRSAITMLIFTAQAIETPDVVQGEQKMCFSPVLTTYMGYMPLNDPLGFFSYEIERFLAFFTIRLGKIGCAGTVYIQGVQGILFGPFPSTEDWGTVWVYEYVSFKNMFCAFCSMHELFGGLSMSLF